MRHIRFEGLPMPEFKVRTPDDDWGHSDIEKASIIGRAIVSAKAAGSAYVTRAAHRDVIKREIASLEDVAAGRRSFASEGDIVKATVMLPVKRKALDELQSELLHAQAVSDEADERLNNLFNTKKMLQAFIHDQGPALEIGGRLMLEDEARQRYEELTGQSEVPAPKVKEPEKPNLNPRGPLAFLDNNTVNPGGFMNGKPLL